MYILAVMVPFCSNGFISRAIEGARLIHLHTSKYAGSVWMCCVLLDHQSP